MLTPINAHQPCLSTLGRQRGYQGGRDSRPQPSPSSAAVANSGLTTTKSAAAHSYNADLTPNEAISSGPLPVQHRRISSHSR